jgi:ProP effector
VRASTVDLQLDETEKGMEEIAVLDGGEAAAPAPGGKCPKYPWAMTAKQKEDMIGVLQSRWPRCFQVYGPRRRPLKVGIHVDILGHGVLTPAELNVALRFYVGEINYLKAVRTGAERIDLNGEIAGTVSERDEARAVGTLAAYAKRWKARQAKSAANEAKTVDLKAHIRGRLLTKSAA